MRNQTREDPPQNLGLVHEPKVFEISVLIYIRKYTIASIYFYISIYIYISKCEREALHISTWGAALAVGPSKPQICVLKYMVVPT